MLELFVVIFPSIEQMPQGILILSVLLTLVLLSALLTSYDLFYQGRKKSVMSSNGNGVPRRN